MYPLKIMAFQSVMAKPKNYDSVTWSRFRVFLSGLWLEICLDLNPLAGAVLSQFDQE